MQMIRPVEIGSNGLDSTTAQTEAYPEWVSPSVPYFDAVIRSLAFSDSGLLAFCTDTGDLFIYDHQVQNITYAKANAGGTNRLMWNEASGILVAADYFDIYYYDTSNFDLIASEELAALSPSMSPTGDAMCYWDGNAGDLVIYNTATRAEVARASIHGIVNNLTDSGSDPFYTIGEASWGDDNETVFATVRSSVGYGALKWNYVSGNSSDTVISSSQWDVSISCEKGGSRFAVGSGDNADQLDIRSKSDLSVIATESLAARPSNIQWSEEQGRVIIRKPNDPQFLIYNPDQNSFSNISLENDFFDPPFSGTGDYIIDASADLYAAGSNNDSGEYGFRLFDPSTLEALQQAKPEYNEGDNVVYRDKIYEALTTTTDRPDNGVKANPATWADMGYINPLRMFDGSVGSQTTADGALEVSIKPTGGQVNAFALFNLEGANARVTMTDPDGNQYYDSGEIALLDESTINNWWAFFFEPYIHLPDQAITDVPPYVDGTINITVDALGSQAAIGELVIGSLVDLGRTIYGSSVGIEDYSRKETDQFGNFDVVERGYSNSAEYDIHLEPFRTPGIKNLLARYRAAPAVYIGSPDRPATVVYGYYRDFSIVLSSYSIDECTIEVEGLQ